MSSSSRKLFRSFFILIVLSSPISVNFFTYPFSKISAILLEANPSPYGFVAFAIEL